MRDNPMSHKLCVVVGAGTGLGLSIAQRFGKEGYAIALIARRPEAPTFNPDKTGQPLSLVWCLRSCFMAGQTAAPGQIWTLNQ
jgi:NAD(P)-dependent dehydrogenase (short-subunit alcohol dehydrogenase family)